MNSRLLGWILIVLSAASFGAMPILIKFAYRVNVDWITILALRFAIASAVLVPVAILRGRRRPTPRSLMLVFIFGACGYVAHSLCYFAALKHATVGLVSLLFYLYPVLVALGGAAFFGERLGKGRLAALAIALLGMGLAAPPGPGNQPLGIALALSCAVIYSAYILACSRVTRDQDSLVTASIVIGGAAVIYGAIALQRGSPLPATAEGWLLIAGIGVLCTSIAIAAFFAALERIGATSAASGATLEPVVTVILGTIVLGERLETLQVVGGALIVGAVAWLVTLRPASSP
jgi:drug/metabolite transporter (DMT)-like permease